MLLFENLVPAGRTDAILKRLLALHPKLIDLKLDRELALLERLGNPQRRLPPVIHIAGTNGKGSTLAYLRAFLEAKGAKVHVMTSPHLVRFNERIRLAGKLVSTRRLNAALERCEAANAGRPITFFEITTAAAFVLFSEVKADYLLLETGMGGRYDASNVVEHPLGTIIAPVDYDHQNFLGPSLAGIAAEKAGILKRGAKAVFGVQREEGRAVLVREAQRLGIVPLIANEDFSARLEAGRLVYQDEKGLLDLPPPALAGPFQIANAALAIAAARHFVPEIAEEAIATGLQRVEWPARLQRLVGPLADMLPEGSELWLDGSHNVHGATALAGAIEAFAARRALKLTLVMGLMNTRRPEEVIAPFVPLDPEIFGLTIPGEPNAHPGEALVAAARALGLEAREAGSFIEALAIVAQQNEGPQRVVICGSLYLAGHVLAANGTPPR